MVQTDLEKPVPVTQQVLNAPEHWGTFQQQRAALMTPPKHVLKAAYLDRLHPTEIAYVVVIGSKRKEKEELTESSMTAAQEGPKFRLVMEDDIDDEDDTSSLSSRTVRENADSDSLSTFCTLDEAAIDALCNSQKQLGEDVSETEALTESEGSLSDGIDEASYRQQDEGLPSALEERLKQLLQSECSRSSIAERAVDILKNTVADSERRERKLQLQLLKSGLHAAEDIPYEEAKQKVEEIAAKMQEIVCDAVCGPEYFQLEQDMERYSAALQLTDEYQAERDASERKWERDVADDNWRALQALRRHMPVNIRQRTLQQLTDPESERPMPVELAKRFKRTNVLTLLRQSPTEIERMHPAQLESMRVTGLTLTERRAVYSHLIKAAAKWKKMQSDNMTGRKYKWFCMMRSNFQESLAHYRHHCQQCGPAENHDCSLPKGCCPVAADKAVADGYTGDYGYPDGDEYEASNVFTVNSSPSVPAADESRSCDIKATRTAEPVEVGEPSTPSKEQTQKSTTAILAENDKESAECSGQSRRAALRKHYKGKLIDMSKANACCERVDEVIGSMHTVAAKWKKNRDSLMADAIDVLNEIKIAALGLVKRAGMQVTGAKQKGIVVVDKRSGFEVALVEELYEDFAIFCGYVTEQTQRQQTECSRVLATMGVLRSIMGELHEQNLQTLDQLLGDKDRPPRVHPKLSFET